MTYDFIKHNTGLWWVILSLLSFKTTKNLNKGIDYFFQQIKGVYYEIKPSRAKIPKRQHCNYF